MSTSAASRLPFEIDALARKVVDLTNGAAGFRAVLDALFEELKSAVGPSDPRHEPLGVPDVQRELALELSALRTELEHRFYSEFCQSYLVLLVRHVGRESLASVIAALDQPPIQQYFDTAAELGRALRTQQTNLMQEMKQAARRAAGLA